MRYTLPTLVLTLMVTASTAQQKGQTGPAFEQEPYGKVPDTKDDKGMVLAEGGNVTLYTLVNRNNLVMKCTEYGAIITELHVPDKDGKKGDIVLGFDKLDGYLKGHPYFGTNAGRSANRIAKGKFKIDGKDFTVATNNDANHLHGGVNGFDKRVWKGEAAMGTTGPSVKFTYTSKDMEEGYPGALTATVTYTLTDNNELVVEYRATTDKPTLCNLAHHSYFNLAGHSSGDIKGHEVQILAKNYTPADDTLIPTGKIDPVAGTAFDFTAATPIGKNLEKAGGKPVGFDLNYVLDGKAGGAPFLAARVTEPKSGRVMEVHTTEPGLQFYSGNFLDGTNTGKGGAVYKQYNGFCMEPQKFPDSVNKPEWKEKSNPVLRPGETYKQTTIYKFSTVK